jgi:hypothetical protein
MSQPQPGPDLNQRGGDHTHIARSRNQGPSLPYPEGLPLVSLLVAAIISFVFLALAPFLVFLLLLEFVSDGGEIGPLSLPIYTHNNFLEALVGTLILTVISLALLMIQRARSFPGWLPFALSFPFAWALILPSALELGGSWLAWLAFGAMVAGVFCLHWQAFNWARTIWD